MSTETILFKKELLLEQIENYLNSGHFTEKEMDRLCAPIFVELEFLQCCDAHNMLVSSTSKPVSSFEEFKEAFLKLVKPVKEINEIEVTDAEILTPNNTQA